MFLSEVHTNGFRCFAPGSPLTLKLHRGLNILVGPNDAGKTAIIDAPRYVLWTRGDDYVRLEPGDFHVTAAGDRCTELLIRCTFDGLTANEQARFLEWCSNEQGQLRLHICLRATRRIMPGGGDAVFTQYRAGRDADGMPLEGELREHLRATYLRPLRDAERELRPGRRSRLSLILGALPHMSAQSQEAAEGDLATLTDTMKTAEAAIDNNIAVKRVQGSVNAGYLNHLSFSNDLLSATLSLGSKGSFDQILERLELYLNAAGGGDARVSRGLGYNNLLFMAAELLLLQSHPEQLPLLLIEEAEAHLHPQHQTLFMEVLEQKTTPQAGGDQQVQVIQTTHSPHLAAGADLQAMTMIVGHKAFPLDKASTKLADDDYNFLRRFLNSTKANLFFARGLLIVEGDAENILLPAIARKLGRPLGKHGVSIVNVGHRGLFRYSRILQRADDTSMPIPVALIPDRDIPPDEARELVGEERRTEGQFSEEDRAAHMTTLRKHDGGCVKSFISEQWTLEFDLARQEELAILVHQACKLAKGSARRTREQLKADAVADVEGWQAEGQSASEIAVVIYWDLYKRNVSKAEVAEQLARLIDELDDDVATFRSKLPAYLIAAIDFATGVPEVGNGQQAAEIAAG